jgi:structural maintenance of chromosome 1
LNGREVAWKAYNAQLEKFNILVKAKNFLVFQGDVEGIASQDSKALARLIDRISGYALIPIYNLAVTKPDRSMDLAADYETARAEQDKATEASAANYAKKRSYNTEVKHFKEQTDEIKMWQKKNDLKVSDPVFSVSLNRLTLCRII